MSRRTITKRNLYPTYVGEDRQINSILRDKEGFIVKPIYTIDGQFVKYVLTDIKDTFSIIPDSNGRRGRGVSRFLKSISDDNIVNSNYTGNLYMYCIHCPNQVLKPVSEFTTNKIQKTTRCHDGLCRQSFCKDCKQTYVNEGDAGNSSRTPDQYLEDCGARLRGIMFIILGEKNKVDYRKLWEKYNGKCFKCDVYIPFENTGDKGLDHTLPMSLWWDYSTEDSTLLCTDCNGSKNNKWTSKFYTDDKLKELSKLTGIDYSVLSGKPYYNPKMIKGFLDNFDKVMSEWSNWGRKKNKKDSFSKFLLTEINRLEKYQTDENVILLTNKLKDYYNKIGRHIYGEFFGK